MATNPELSNNTANKEADKKTEGEIQEKIAIFSEGSTSTQTSQNETDQTKSSKIANTTPSTNIEGNTKDSSIIIKKKKVKKRYSPPIVFNCLYTQYDVIKESAEEIGWKLSFDENDEWDVFWSDLPIGPEKFTKMRNYQRINHFQGMYNIWRKNLLAKNIKKMQKLFPNDYKIIPRTWLLPYEYNDLKNFVTEKRVVSMIVKPEAACQGKGIYIQQQ